MISQAIVASALLLAAVQIPGQTRAAAVPAPGAATQLAQSIHQVLVRSTDGHSPTDEEIAAVASFNPAPGVADVEAALPYLQQAISNPDLPVRLFALTALAGIEVAPQTAASVPPAADAGSSLPAAYKPEVATLLTPLIPLMATHLTEESEAARALTVTILAGFTPNPPPSVYTPLYAYLRRDEAVGQVGTAVVQALLHLGPVSAESASAVAHFLLRSDQTPDSRANLVDTIASEPNQSRVLNKSLLSYMDGDDATLEARIILSLPALDLSPEVFADMQARVATLAADTGQNLQVTDAAKAVQPCWTSVKMASGCPRY